MSSPTRPSPKSFLKLSSDIASFYGFRSIHDLEAIAPQEKIRGMHSFATAARVGTAVVNTKPTVPELSGEPALFYYATLAPSHLPASLPQRDSAEFGLSIVGSSESMGEVLLIKVITAILEEWGSTLSCIRINALGDRDSQQRFARELTLYLRKHTAVFESAAGKMSDNPFVTYQHAAAHCSDILIDAPCSINFLSEKSRIHFRTILEQLEQLNLPYRIDSSLMSDEREARVLFALDLADTDTTIYASLGGRYDDFVRRLTGRKESATVHGSIFFHRKGLERTHCAVRSKTPSAKIYFVQLGSQAKLQGLTVLDMLRTARIPSLQSFDSRHLSIQLAQARKARVSHVLIMGQREVLDKTIIVRSADERAQTTIALAQLPKYLKTLRV